MDACARVIDGIQWSEMSQLQFLSSLHSLMQSPSNYPAVIAAAKFWSFRFPRARPLPQIAPEIIGLALAMWVRLQEGNRKPHILQVILSLFH